MKLKYSMMKRPLLLFLIFIVSTPVFAQKTGLVTDFRFIVNDTQEFPNFFEDEDLTKLIFQKGLHLVKKKLKIDSVQTYQAKEIEYRFRPPFRENLKYVERKKYDFYVSIVSSAGINTSSKGDKTYIIYSKVKVENQQNDTVFINRSKAVFTLSYENSALYDEAVVTKSDFQNLYTTLLENTFFENSSNLETEFIKPAIIVYNGFMKKAEKVVIKQIDKLASRQFVTTTDTAMVKFMNIKSKPMSIAGTVKIQGLADILRFNKEFILKDNTTKKRFKIKGNYEEATDYETKVRYIKSTKLTVRNRGDNYVLEFYPDKETSWVYTLEWEILDGDKYELLANRYTNFVEVFSNGGLIAIIQLPSSGVKLQETQNRDFTFYYRTNLTDNIKNDVNALFAYFIIANQFMAEVSEMRKL